MIDLNKEMERVYFAAGGREFQREMEEGKKELEKEDVLEKGSRKLHW